MKKKNKFFETGKIDDFLIYIKEKNNKNIVKNGETDGVKGRNSTKNN